MKLSKHLFIPFLLGSFEFANCATPLSTVVAQAALSEAEGAQRLLQSIHDHGILNASQVRGHTGHNPITSADRAQNDYVSMTGKSRGRPLSESALKTWVFDEVIGFMNIAIERNTRAEIANKREYTKELAARLENVVVFVTEHPSEEKVIKTKDPKNRAAGLLDAMFNEKPELADDPLIAAMYASMSRKKEQQSDIEVTELYAQGPFRHDQFIAIITTPKWEGAVRDVFGSLGKPIIVAPKVQAQISLGSFTTATALAYEDDNKVKVGLDAPDFTEALRRLEGFCAHRSYATHLVRFNTQYEIRTGLSGNPTFGGETQQDRDNIMSACRSGAEEFTFTHKKFHVNDQILEWLRAKDIYHRVLSEDGSVVTVSAEAFLRCPHVDTHFFIPTSKNANGKNLVKALRGNGVTILVDYDLDGNDGYRLVFPVENQENVIGIIERINPAA